MISVQLLDHFLLERKKNFDQFKANFLIIYKPLNWKIGFHKARTPALNEFIRCAGSESLVLLINSLSVLEGNRSI